jgi:hypothetical protein
VLSKGHEFLGKKARGQHSHDIFGAFLYFDLIDLIFCCDVFNKF